MSTRPGRRLIVAALLAVLALAGCIGGPGAVVPDRAGSVTGAGSVTRAGSARDAGSMTGARGAVPAPAMGAAARRPSAARTRVAPRAAAPVRVGLPGGRSYLLSAPPGSGRRALVIALHQAYSSAPAMARQTGLAGVAARDGFVVAFGQGIGGLWNAGGCCTRARTDDVGYLRQVVASVEARVRIDPQRVYVMGMSNGAMMAFRAVCQAPRTFAAAVVVAGVLMPGVPCRTTVVRVLEVHGRADTTVPLWGGRGFEGIEFPSHAGEAARIGRGSTLVLDTVTGGHYWPAGTAQRGWQFVARYRLAAPVRRADDVVAGAGR